MELDLNVSAAGSLNLTQVQLEAGSSASTFDDRGLATEQARCDRFYQRLDSADRLWRRFGLSTTFDQFVVPFRARMRAPPVFSYSNLADFSYGANFQNVTSMVVTGMTKENVLLTVSNSSGLTSTSQLTSYNTTSAWMGFDAEP